VNDADRRRSPDGFDDDAIFADIVAHLNDDDTEDEQAGHADGLTDKAAADTDTADRMADEGDAESTTLQPGDRSLPPHDTTLGDKPVGDRPPGDTLPGDTLPGDTLPGDTLPGDTLPGDTLPGGDPARGPGHWAVNPPPWLPKPIHPPVDPAVHPPVEPPVDPAPQVWRAHEVGDEVEEHFEPPPVTPLPAGDLQFWAIIAGMTVGPLLLLYLVFFNRNASSYWIFAAIAMSVGGFALLVSRMPGQNDDDDDGARL
jgi:hypothetical protein